MAFSVLFSFLIRKRKEKPNSSNLINLFLNFSYQNLYNATIRFSLANLISVGGFGFVYKGNLNEDRIIIIVKVLTFFIMMLPRVL